MRIGKVALGLILGIAALVAGSCAVPIPHKTAAIGPAGPLRTSPSAASVIPSITTKDEVHRQLGVVEIPIGLENHSWSRWIYSKLKILWIIAAPGAQGVIGESEVHHRINLLIDFDSNGVVSAARTVDDGDLVGELSRWARGTRDLPPPLEMSVFHLHASLSKADYAILRVKPDSLTVECPGNSGHQLTVPMSGIKLRSVASDAERGSGLVRVVVTSPVRSTMGTGRLLPGSAVTLRLTAADLFRLVETLEHYSKAP